MTRLSFLIPAILSLLIPVSLVHASNKNEPPATDRHESRILLSVDYFVPSEDDRNIRTANVNAYVLLGEIEILRLSLHAGLTGTYATGDITQLEGELEAGTLREVNFENTAFGLGPGLLARIRLLDLHPFSLHLGGAGSLILYNEVFPAGGEIYNFMWRAGPVLRFAVNEDQSIGVGYQLMHVSNGRGTTSKNPSYDAWGLNLQWMF